MATYIIVTEGPMKGERFEIKGGERIGRDKGEIVLNDTKVSSQHALVKKSLLGQLMLVDQRSKNGIIVEGKRVDRVKLTIGTEFRIGANLFQVEVIGAESNISSQPESISKSNDLPHEESISLDQNFEKPEVSPITEAQDPSETIEHPDNSRTEGTDSKLDSKPIVDGHTFLYDPNSSDSEEEPTVIQPAAEKESSSSLSLKDLTIKGKADPDSKVSFRTLEQKSDGEEQGLFEDHGKKTWSGVLEKFSRKNLRAAMDQSKNIEALKPRVKLTFFRGTQAETEWELGYGPRIASSTSPDLPIWDPSAPSGDCFMIYQSESGPQFSTNFPNIVKINGMSVEEVSLKSGDIISIAETEIEVELF